MSLALAGTTVPPNPAGGLLERYCSECHNADNQEGGLDLSSLAFDLDDKATASRWEKLFDRVESQQMPPETAEQPTEDERGVLLATLREPLHAASLQRQQREGRVPLRRLSRTQYEDTLRDLLGLPALEVQNLLPEDAVSNGFDQQATAQSTSSVHLVRYQEAADKALAAAVPKRTFVPLRMRKTGREILETHWNPEGLKSLRCWLQDDALVMSASFNRPYNAVGIPAAPVDGRYRIRLTGYALHNEGKTMPVTFNYLETPQLPYGENLGWRDLYPDKPSTVEVELNLQAGQVADIVGWTFRWQDPVPKGQPFDMAVPSIAISVLEAEGPLDTWPPQSYQRLFDNLPLQTSAERLAEQGLQNAPTPREHRSIEEWNKDPLAPTSSHPKEDAARLLKSFLSKAFRRPVPDAMLRHYTEIASGLLDEGISFEEAMIETYKSALCSPYFLFFTETPGLLDHFALASRLSYFLWNSAPDDELLALAASGKLAEKAVLHQQVERLLSDARADRFVKNFVGQWLDLRRIDATSPDMQLHPEFDRILQESSVAETELFFGEVLRNDLSLLNFVDSDWTYLNQRLAEHYGIVTDEPLGHELSKVTLPAGSHRGGVITHASVLKVTADGTHTSPILRGKWICERILGIHPSPPPAGIPGVEPDIRGATTIRQQLAKHRDTAACNSCHTIIDPPGFALESYDVIGGWRDFYRASQSTGKVAALVNYPKINVHQGPAVEIGDFMPDGRPFADIQEYKRLILEDKDALARNLIHKMMAYATGTDIQFADREEVERILETLRHKDFGLRTLIHAITESRIFASK